MMPGARGSSRAGAIAIAVAGVLDPSFSISRGQPRVIAVVVSEAPTLALPARDTTRHARALAAREELTRQLGPDFRVVNTSVPSAAATIVIGDTPPAAAELPAAGPVHAVSVAEPVSPNLRISETRAPARMHLLSRARVAVTLKSRDLAGKSSAVTLTQNGMEVARHTYAWTRGEETRTIALSFSPSAAGPAALRVRVEPQPEEKTDADNAADVLIDVFDTPYPVLMYEPRPSWTGTFVRRALEQDPRFDIASISSQAPGVVVTRGGSPASLLPAGAVDRFDAIVVGAPDALTAPEVAAIGRFARERGGGVVLLADTRARGQYASLAPALILDEVLLDRPVALMGPRPPAPGPQFLSVSEVLPVLARPGIQTLLTIDHQGARRPIVVSGPMGRGHVLFSGALDAWRFRALEGSPFDAFWREQIGVLAALTPPPLRVTVRPTVLRPGERGEVSVEMAQHQSSAAPPAMLTVQMMPAPRDGARPPPQAIRVWPAVEDGIFAGTFVAPPESGLYRIAAALRGTRDAEANAPLRVATDAVRPMQDDIEGLRLLAQTRGGIYATPAELARVAERVKAMTPIRYRREPWHPLRSAWWIVPFTLLLGCEWWLRRRVGNA